MSLRDTVTASIGELGTILADGVFVESPFDQPLEEQRLGDPDQREDDLKFTAGAVCTSLEPGLGAGRKAVQRGQHPGRFKFFLDGSLRTKYLGDYVEDRYSFPILATENVSAVIRRDGTSLHTQAIGDRLAFIFPHKESGVIADTTFERIDALRTKLVHSGSRVRIEFLQKSEVQDVRHSMLGKARHLMHELEHELASALPRDDRNWLVMDGAIRRAEFMALEYAIGLAKSFSRRPVFDLGDGKPLMITSYLSQVRAGERSAIFKQSDAASGDADLLFWYLRLRTFPPMEPLGGLVKIDLSLRGAEFGPDWVKLIDEISAEVFDMRLPSLFPYPRWPSYVYPIRAAELAMKSHLQNPEILGYFGHLLKERIQKAKQ